MMSPKREEMTETLPNQLTVDKLQQQEIDLTFDQFDHSTAWAIGVVLVDLARSRSAAVVIDIRRPGQVLFHASLPGSTPESDNWIERKSRTVFRFETSTLLLQKRFESAKIAVESLDWFDGSRHTTSGGSFPIHVRSAGVIAAITVSGLQDFEDHQLIIDSLNQYFDTIAARP
jgi:uncharacterized protein (UPF0303 family)